MNSIEPRLGIDIGRVIIGTHADSTAKSGSSGGSSRAAGDTAFFAGDEATMLATPEMAGAGLTHFVDDHPEVPEAIRGAVTHQYFFGPQAAPVPGYGRHAPDWAQARQLIGAATL